MPAGAPHQPGARQYVVIGAGVLGVALTARLAEAAGPAAAVTLLEQNRPGHAATRSSFAWLNANHKLPRAYHDLTTPVCGPGPRWPTASAARTGTGRRATWSGPAPRTPPPS
jgi:glycine/D-amino acid oxidase-like deaminating enzyme